MRERQFGSNKSSWASSFTHSADAIRQALFQLSASGSNSSDLLYRMYGLRLANSEHMSGVSSVDALSEMTISTGAYVCARALSSASRKKKAPLRTGTAIENWASDIRFFFCRIGT
jgi:hypothetical protein